MTSAVVECVPNFSEGRDPAVIAQIVDAIAAIGVQLLNVDPGADTNRTVVTFVGSPDAVVAGAFAGVAKAAEVIDMTTQSGAHPRMGATDVCPFAPVEGITLDECADLARRLGQRVGDELGIPVYLYEAAAAPERRNLATVRRGEYDDLAEKMADPRWAPDFDPAAPHPRAGALITGAREFLIAYKASQHVVRSSLRLGGRNGNSQLTPNSVWIWSWPGVWRIQVPGYGPREAQLQVVLIAWS